MIDFVNSKMVGMAYPAISDSDFYNGLFPIPPLAEQKRIVAKVNALIALCDELEKQVEKSQENSGKLMEAVLKESFAQ
ncbi:MAG: hypothetical protein A2Y36_00640 [Treponema sp. GWA1_62_8]|nr:MAG: hypothetical protein A2Y36_00640 [Treponema sp. GWA1_62_8]